MSQNHIKPLEQDLEQKIKRREKKKKPKMLMHGKATREIVRLWQKSRPS